MATVEGRRDGRVGEPMGTRQQTEGRNSNIRKKMQETQPQTLEGGSRKKVPRAEEATTITRCSSIDTGWNR